MGTIENIIEKKRATAIRKGMSEGIWNLAFPVWKSGKNENKRMCWMMYRVLSGEFNKCKRQYHVQETHHWNPNHLGLIGVLLPVQSSEGLIWTPVIPL